MKAAEIHAKALEKELQHYKREVLRLKAEIKELKELLERAVNAAEVLAGK